MRIPKKAKRVYKGQIFEVYEWRQKEFDGSYKTCELVKRVEGDFFNVVGLPLRAVAEILEKFGIKTL